jgi:biopolymer transport protein ExbD
VARHRTLQKDAPIDVQLPITPMLDMSFQLLAFFVMTFKAANAYEGQLDLHLPRAGVAAAKTADQVSLTENSDVDIAPASDVAVVVAARADGSVESLTVREKATATPAEDLKALKAALKKIHAELGGSQNSLKIESDGRLKYAKLVEVMDACIEAGFKQVGFAPPPELKR